MHRRNDDEGFFIIAILLMALFIGYMIVREKSYVDACKKIGTPEKECLEILH